jgi:hypothetical protein
VCALQRAITRAASNLCRASCCSDLSGVAGMRSLTAVIIRVVVMGSDDRAGLKRQGTIIIDTAILTQLDLPLGQSVVEIPPALLAYLAVDGVQGSVTNLVPPIVGVTGRGHYIIQGKRITDSEVLGQMSIPEHESCVQVTRSAMLALVGE